MPCGTSKPRLGKCASPPPSLTCLVLISSGPELGRTAKVRLLLGTEPRPETVRLEVALDQLDAALRHDGDLLLFDAVTHKAVRRLLDFLDSGKMEVRLHDRQFLHAKAYIFRVGGGCIVGSSNLTYGGLVRNLELNLGCYEDTVVARVENWFDELWEQSKVYDLKAIYNDWLMDEYSPYLIYLRVLWELYGPKLEQPVDGIDSDIPLTEFQKHGVAQAQRILNECGGVLVADGVGLGKTLLACEIIRRYRKRRDRVLLVCPASLRGMWTIFLNRYQLHVDCVSYEKLAHDKQLGGARSHLMNQLDDYALVVIDEAHNYRNPDTRRADVLRHLLMGNRPTCSCFRPPPSTTRSGTFTTCLTTSSDMTVC